MRQLFRAFANLIPEIPTARGSAPRAQEHPTFSMCSDAAAALTVDIHGRTSYRREGGWNHQSLDPSEFSDTQPKLPVDKGPAAIKNSISCSLAVGKKILKPEVFKSAKGVVKQEVVVVADIAEAKPAFALGRILVRLMVDDTHYLQAVYSPGGELQRVDLFLTPDHCSQSIADIFKAKQLPKRMMQPQEALGDELTLGCFYSTSEDRFNLAAYGCAGEEFLDVTQERNPFVKDKLSREMPQTSKISAYPESDADRYKKRDAAMVAWVEEYRKSDASRFWCWYWWDLYGRVGSFRGNSIPHKEGKWTMPNHRLLFVNSLGSYATQGDFPKKYWSQGFLRDLTSCNVAYLYAHAGPIDGILQTEGPAPAWVRFFPQNNISDSSLRHLLIEGCGTFTLLHPGKNEHPHLVETWIKGKTLEGLRTASGVDGPHGGVERDGWRFFGYYNKGEPISDAWAFGILDENANLWPVTAAYAGSTKTALSDLALGRFSKTKAERGAAVFSIWTSAFVFDRPQADLKPSPEFAGD